MKVSEQLRNSIHELHQLIELTPFARAMMGDHMDRNNYAFALIQFWWVHNTLEQQASKSMLPSFFTPEMIRTQSIANDLSFFSTPIDSMPKLPSTNRAINRIQYWGDNRPESLLGCLYVLEGSRMGSLVIARPLGKALALEPNSMSGLEYHLEGAASTPARVKQLKSQIDQYEWTPEQIEAITEGATEFMAIFYAMYQGLPSESRTPHAHLASAHLNKFASS